MVNYDKALEFYVNHSRSFFELFLALTLGVILLWIIIRWGKESKDRDIDSFKEVEEAMRRVLAAATSPIQTATDASKQIQDSDKKAPAPAAGATPAAAATPGAPAAAATPANADELNRVKADADAKAKKVAELEAALGAAQAAAKTAGGAGDPAKLAELNKRIAELEGRLNEYAIIEDDIANLNLYKAENARLKTEMEQFKAGGAPATPPATAAPTPPPAAAPPPPTPAPAPAAAAPTPPPAAAAPPPTPAPAAPPMGGAMDQAAIDAMLNQAQAPPAPAAAAAPPAPPKPVAPAAASSDPNLEDILAQASALVEGKATPKPAQTPPAVPTPAPASGGAMDQADIDAILNQTSTVPPPSPAAPSAPAPAAPESAAPLMDASEIDALLNQNAPKGDAGADLVNAAQLNAAIKDAENAPGLDPQIDPNKLVSEFDQLLAMPPPPKPGTEGKDSGTALIEEFENFMKDQNK